MSNTNPARGMRDFLPADIRKRNYVIGIIREVYEKYGFEPLETPTIENLSTLTNKYGEEGDQLMFKILKRGEKLKRQLKRDDAKENDLTDLALRYDLTVPLARVVANYRHELPKFFKRYQIQPVWRADRPARGRYREFYQCDVDAIGSKSMIVEAELCSAISEILEKLGFDDFVIRVNDRRVLEQMLFACEISDEKHSDALVSLDKIDKIGHEKVLIEMLERGIKKESAEKLVRWFKETEEDRNEHNRKNGEWNEHIRDKLYHSFFKASNNFEVTSDLDLISRKLVENSVASEKIEIDPSLARGLSYYTGAIFEVILTNGDFSGSIAGGGRYDGLIGMFGKEEIPAVGLSIGLERILLVMEERGIFEQLEKEGKLETNAADVLVTVWNEESAGESLKLASELREKNLRVLVYPNADKLGKQFKYANQINVEYVCVIGDNELKENTVQIKNMKTGEQENVARDETTEKIKSSSKV